MGKALGELRILLVQARNTLDMEHQEQRCFTERCKVTRDQFVIANVVRDPLARTLLDDVDALMIGGAGEYSARKDYPWMGALMELLHEAYDRAVPTFGSCWGHQLLARAFGGEVIYDNERAEFGCGFIELTEAGTQDRLFSILPSRFRANLGHQDRVARLPDDAVELAFNDSQPNQAFRFKNRPIYGTQFHSELDAEAERERLYKYRAYYVDEMGDDTAFQQAIASLAPTTEVDHLLNDFLRTYVCNEG